MQLTRSTLVHKEKYSSKTVVANLKEITGSFVLIATNISKSLALVYMNKRRRIERLLSIAYVLRGTP
jgi:hypothetical protein